MSNSQGLLSPPDLPNLLTRRDDEGRVRSIMSSHEWPPRVRDILQRVKSVLGTAPPVVPPLDAQTHGEEDCGTYWRRQVSYQVEPGERCPAWLLVPKPLVYRRSAVLCCHQTIALGKGEPAGLGGLPDLHYALELVQRGYVCLAPDSIAAGERVYPGHDPFDTAAFYQLHPEWSALGKMLWDHKRALDYLCALDEVNQDCVGVIGHALGGVNALMLGAYDHRVKATVAACAYTPFAVDPLPDRWCRNNWFVFLPLLKPFIHQGQHPPFTWLELLSLIAPRALHYTYALDDVIMPNSTAVARDMAQLGQLYDLLGSRMRLGYYEHKGDHGHPPAAREAAYRLLATVLPVD